MELRESTEETARREVEEETGLLLGELHLLNVYSGADQFIKAANGDEFYVVTTAYFTREFHGEMRRDLSESIQLSFYPFSGIPQSMVSSHRHILNEYRERMIR